MRSFLLTAFLLYFFLPISHAQYTVVTLSTGMFTQHQQIMLADLEGWIFNPGHSQDNADPNNNISDWHVLKPVELTAKMADEQGRIEGWFRIRINIET